MTDGVSRETPSPPGEAVGVFGDQLPRAEAYVHLLADVGTARGLIGPREAPRLWERHILSCAVVTDLLPPGATVGDVGSGAGLPGVPMAIRRPDLRVTLVEPMLRRTRFLEEVVTELGLDNVEVVRARAEQLHGRRSFDAVVSRALAPLERLLPWSLPLVAAGGCVLAMKGRSATEEVESVEETLAQAGLGPPQLVVVGGAELVVPTTVVRVEVGRSASLRWTQRSGGGRRRRSPRR